MPPHLKYQYMESFLPPRRKYSPAPSAGVSAAGTHSIRACALRVCGSGGGSKTWIAAALTFSSCAVFVRLPHPGATGRISMKVYLDNNIVSAMVRSDLAADEMTAVRKIKSASADGKIEVVTSRETHREQSRTKNEQLRAALEQDRPPLVKEDHRLLGIRAQFGDGWFANCPILTEVVDESLFSTFKAAGLEDADARHLMYAVHNSCERFVTTDPDFLERRPELENSCRGLRIVKPTELAGELLPDPA
jgi:predicted nucleic acid-binding protein